MDRRTKHIIVLIAWLMLFFVIGSGVWDLMAGELMLILYMIISVLAYVIYAFVSRCPRCRMPLLLRPLKIPGIELYVWSLLTPDRCRHCGEPIL